MNIVDSTDLRTLGFIHGTLALFLTPFLMRAYRFSDFASQSNKVFSKVLFALFMLLLPVGAFLVLLSFLGYSQFQYLGVLLFVIGIAPAIKILKNREQVSDSVRFLGYTEIIVAIILIAVGIIGYEQSGWFSITYLVGSWDSIQIWTGLLRLLILLIVCVIVSRFIK